MAELLKTLGFEPVKFFFTILNFLVVFFLLKIFLFGRIMKILENRKEKIQRGLKDAEQAAKELERAQGEAERIIAAAKTEAEKIRKEAEGAREDILAKAKSEAENIVKESRATIEAKKKEIRKEMYAQLIDLVSLATRKVLDQVVGEEEQRILVEKAVEESLEEVSS